MTTLAEIARRLAAMPPLEARAEFSKVVDSAKGLPYGETKIALDLNAKLATELRKIGAAPRIWKTG